MGTRRSITLSSAVLVTTLLTATTACNRGQSMPPNTHATGTTTSITPTGINATEAAQLIPLAPLSVTAAAVANGIVVMWPGTGQDDVHYKVLRKIAGANDWHQLATVQAVGDNRGQYKVTDTTAQRGVTYVYGVTAVSFSGKESAVTQSNTITLPSP